MTFGGPAIDLSEVIQARRLRNRGQHVLFGEIGKVRLQGQGEGIAVIGCGAEPMYQAAHRPGSSALVAVIPGAGLHPATAKFDDSRVRGVLASINDNVVIEIASERWMTVPHNRYRYPRPELAKVHLADLHGLVGGSSTSPIDQTDR